MKSDYFKMQQLQSRRHTPRFLDPPPYETVIHLLEQLESGSLDAWWQLNMEMTLKPDSQYYNNEFELDLTKLPGWQEANDVTRNRIIKGAKQYIQQQNDINYDWIGTNEYNLADLSGCRALCLLLQKEPTFLDKLSSEIWRKWASIIVAFPSDNQHDECHIEIMRRSYANAPDEVISTLMKLIDKENHDHDYIFVIDKFEQCWDARFELALLEKTKDKLLKPKCMGKLLDVLLKHESNEAREFANSLIAFPLPSAEDERERVLQAAKVIVVNSQPSSWSLIWPIIQKDSSFGRLVFELVENQSSHGIQLNLTEKQLADLYIWLVHQYPFAEDPDYSNEVFAHCETTRERLRNLRNSVLVQLKQRGTLQACAELQRVIQELPTITWLKKTLLEAQKNMRRKTWQPLKPEEIIQLVLDQDKRLVQDGNQLLNVLLESLKRLELELQGETPAVRDLWDKISNNYFKPIDENAFSDYVKRFLDKDLKSRGIIVNREVELRRGYGGEPGERTDIHVDAVLKQPNGETYDSITVIIEVKGCWHDELKTAMETQLVKRYLNDNICRYGLYLIGWFNCHQWDAQDSRKKKTLKISIDDARKQFDEQAERLSISGNVVRAYVLNASLR